MVKFKSMVLIVCTVYGATIVADDPSIGLAAPIVSVIFSNETNQIENVLTLVSTGEYFGNKNAGAYYPHLIPAKGVINRDSFAFDPGALEQGPNVYPFMFSYKGSIHYLVFVTSKILEEKTEFPFFATIIKVTSINEADNSVEIETVANLYFKQNDTLAVALQPQGLAFGNVTNQTLASFVNDKKPEAEKKKVMLIPKTKPKRKVRLKPLSKPKPVVSLKLRNTRPVLSPKTTPAPARAR